MVIIGVKEFNIPASELLKPVSATENKIAGIRFERNPSTRIFFQLFLNTVPIYLVAIGNSSRKAKVTLIVPT